MRTVHDVCLPLGNRFPGNRRPSLLILFAAFVLLSALTARPIHAQDIPSALSDEVFVAGQAMSVSIPLDTGSFLNGGYAIDSAGFADLPVLGKIQVAGHMRSQVEEFLAQKMANYIKDTHVRAIPCIRLTLLGFWTRQGQYYVSPNTTVWEAVFRAGGLGGERTLDHLKVMRGETELDIHLLDEYSAGKTLTAAGIRSGDLFVLPVPRDNSGAWYWFKEGLTATAQIATIFGTVLTAYITYTVINRN